MTDRIPLIDSFIERAGWLEAARHPMPGDLSVRRYVRLTKPTGETAMLMDAPPETDASMPEFLRMTNWLRAAGLAAPSILATDTHSGMLLLEDLGDQKVSDIASTDPDLRNKIYGVALDILVHIRAQDHAALWRPNASELVKATLLTDEFYPGIQPVALSGLRRILEAMLTDFLGGAVCVSLRDFHADNLMWLPDRAGLKQLGLLDYQDAFLTHPVYDLVSLLTDARIDIDPGFRRQEIALYATKTGDDPDKLGLAFAAFSVQRNLRILGIFTRAARQFGKSRHLPKLSRVHGYLSEALRHPAFASVADEALAAVPRPTQDMIEALT